MELSKTNIAINSKSQAF